MKHSSDSEIQKSVLSYLEHLVGFDTQNPPRDLSADSEIFSYLSSVLGDSFEIEITDHGLGRVSFFALRGKPKLIFNVHIDTVPIVKGWDSDAHQLVVKDEKAIALGACDIKGAAACLLSLALQDTRDLALLFTTDEEGADGHCVKAFVETEQAKMFSQAIVAEPTQCQAIVEHSGFVSVTGNFIGYSGHSSNLEALAKSATHACMLWGHQALQYVNDHYANNSKARFNIGVIKGGVKSNITAGQAYVRWSARLLPGSDTESFVKNVNACAPENTQVDWNESFYGEPLPNAEFTNDKAKAFVESQKLSFGEPVGFWTEAAIFHQAGIPAIVLGPGDIAQAHTANEWVALEQLVEAYHIYEKVSR